LFSKSIHRLIDDLKTELPSPLKNKLTGRISEIQERVHGPAENPAGEVEVSADQKQIRITG